MFQFLAITWFVTVGWVPLQDETIGSKAACLEHGRVATVAELGFSADVFERLTFSASMENYQYVSTSRGYFSPYRVDYKAALTLRVTENISITAAHECDHPIYSETKDKSKPLYMSGETIVSVTWKSK